MDRNSIGRAPSQFVRLFLLIDISFVSSSIPHLLCVFSVWPARSLVYFLVTSVLPRHSATELNGSDACLLFSFVLDSVIRNEFGTFNFSRALAPLTLAFECDSYRRQRK